MIRKIAIVLSGLALCGLTRAAAPADVTPLLQPILAKHAQVPALFAAIVDGGQVTALGAVGVRKLNDPTPVTPDDLIHLGSDTKAMTGLLIGQLIQAKQLSFDTTMAEVFPDLAGSMNAAYKSATIRQLLQHTAGLSANLGWAALNASGKPLIVQRRAAVKQALSAAPLTPPGSKFAYSNVSFVILGAVLEQKTGKPWETLIQEKIFDPLKMSSAGFGAPGTPGKIDQPWGHSKGLLGITPSQFDNPPVMGPAGRVHCTMRDWAKFIEQFSGPADGDPHLLDDATIQALIAPSAGGTYSGGWIVLQRPWAGGAALTHDGSNTFWYCSVWIAPARHFAMLAATNSGTDDATAACQEMIDALLKTVLKP